MQVFSNAYPASSTTTTSTYASLLANITCSKDEVYDVSALSNKTAAGPDGISSVVVKSIDAIVPSPKISICHWVLVTFFAEWKRSNVTSVYKNGDPKLASNYRPISLLFAF